MKVNPATVPERLKHMAAILVDASDLIEDQPNKAWGLVAGCIVTMIEMAEAMEKEAAENGLFQ